MPDKLQESFGLIISILCPGLLTLWAVTRVYDLGPVPGQALGGGFFFVLVAAIGVGVFLGGVRQIVFELGVLRIPRLRAYVGITAGDAFEEELRKDAGAEAAYRDLRSSFLPYYHFFSHMAVAVLLIYPLWCWKRPELAAGARVGIGLALVEGVLVYNAIHSLRRFLMRRTKLLSRPTKFEIPA